MPVEAARKIEFEQKQLDRAGGGAREANQLVYRGRGWAEQVVNALAGV